MNLTEYENPSDPYAPRARASQTVAAQKRAAAASPGRPTHDTEPITPIGLATPARQYVPFGIGALVIILLMIGMASYQLSREGARPLQLTSVPTEAAPSVALAAPTLAPTAVPDVTTINAYAAPEGQLLGPIETDRMITPIAHYGGGWIQADVEGSGVVWLRKGDLPDVALTGPDLAPHTAAAPQTGQGLTISGQGSGNEWTPPENTPELEAEPTATPIVWPTSAPAAIPDFEKPDIRGTCQFVGCLGAKAVDLERAQACHALFWQYGNADPEKISEPDYSAVRACVWEGLYR